MNGTPFVYIVLPDMSAEEYALGCGSYGNAGDTTVVLSHEIW